jgi:ferredoxin
MKIAVSENCVGHGQCYSIAPDLLTHDEDGFVSIRGSEVEVPADQVAAAQDAKDSCPENAISLIE